jgi:urease subunit gamma/beta
MRPGEVLFGQGPIVLHAGRRTTEVEVENTSDHTIFVSSHFPFFEVNRRLVFERAAAWGMHLDVPAGDSVRFRPGERKRVRLVAFGGRGVVRGFNRLTDGAATPARLAEGLERVRLGGYGHRPPGGGAAAHEETPRG